MMAKFHSDMSKRRYACESEPVSYVYREFGGLAVDPEINSACLGYIQGCGRSPPRHVQKTVCPATGEPVSSIEGIVGSSYIPLNKCSHAVSTDHVEPVKRSTRTRPN